MVAEALPNSHEAPPVVIGLQPAALIDNVAPVDWSLLDQIPGDRGGSIPVQKDELEHILKELDTHVTAAPLKKMAGGSGVSISRLRKKKGSTGQVLCLLGDDSGNRTMRPCLSSAVKIQADELSKDDFTGSKWLVLRYAVLNLEVIKAAIGFAKQEGLSMVRNYRSELRQLLESGNIDLCFANEDEAAELLRAKKKRARRLLLSPKQALQLGCVVQVPAIGETIATDATGAGDLFASGFLYGLIKGIAFGRVLQNGIMQWGISHPCSWRRSNPRELAVDAQTVAVEELTCS
ncbi:hypothetical protein HID58_069250 [Brassica napus]|uniref:Carbohydrate kinase PfkB domain-containing protein n=1 Tax=Brassica napus TaxID=3708 RepID=A0ABQ7XEP0_BRANA|nr:hypothetical protein HID58_069250 [Brassica napus]